jgi:hypothetical protein
VRKSFRLLVALVVALAVGAILPVVHAPTASAEIYRDLGKVCVGTRAIRCAWLHLDSTNNRVRAYGAVWDNTGGSANVGINVCMAYQNADGSATVVLHTCNSVPEIGPAISYHSDTYPCYDGRQYRAHVFWTWDPPGPEHEDGILRSNWVKPNVC